jgi:hypothetical protein
LPGLTRQSIVLKILGFFKMDARVKPAHDESIIARMSINPPDFSISSRNADVEREARQ